MCWIDKLILNIVKAVLSKYIYNLLQLVEILIQNNTFQSVVKILNFF